MTQLVLTLLAATGLSHILVEAKIFEPLRVRLGALEGAARCYQCSGFWAGLWCGLASYGQWLPALGCAFAASLASTAAATILNWFQLKS